MNDDVPVASECPGCGQQRVAHYTRQELLELLRMGRAIEAWCVSCDKSWPPSAKECWAIGWRL